MRMDITGFINEFLRICWKIIEFPFLLWNKIPAFIRWTVFIIIGIIALIILIDAIKKRNLWRHYYVE